MVINGSGIRDTARVLQINKDTVLNKLTKRIRNRVSNKLRLEQVKDQHIEIQVIKVRDKEYIEVEMDEIWSYIRNQKEQRWLWYAIEKQSKNISICLRKKGR